MTKIRVEIDIIFIVHTFFHYYFLESIRTDITNGNILFLTSSEILKKKIQKEGFNNQSFQVEVFNTELGLKERIRKSPFKQIIKLRQTVQQQKANIKYITNKYVFAKDEKLKIFIANEQDIFTQIFIKDKKKSNIFGFEDGIGTYLNSPKNKLITKIVYPFLSFLATGTIINYYRPYGSANFLKRLYLRYPNRKKTIIPVEVVNLKKTSKTIKNRRESVLIFTSPFSEFNILTITEEKKLYNLIIDTVIKNEIELFIKQHPSESQDKIINDDLSFLNKNEVGESIDYASYSMIVNFSSSVIYDVIDSEFPPNRILTITGFNNEKIQHPFLETYNINYHEVDENKIDKFILATKNTFL